MDNENQELLMKAGNDAINSLLDLGRSWSAYGLTVGKLALETSAQTLAITAEALGELANNFDKRDQA